MATHTDTPSTPWILAAAAPGGIAFGLAIAWGYLRVVPLFSGTLGSSLADLATTFAAWLLAERIHVSPVLTVVAFGMLVSWRRPAWQPARDRLQSAAVWSATVLVLNVVAFMLMGLQSREILQHLPEGERLSAIGFSLLVLLVVILVRLAWVFAVRGVEGLLTAAFKPRWLPKPPPLRASFVLAWAGMRGLVTLAAAFALPSGFPKRDLIVLAAFTVVIGTLVFQGLTLGPLIRWLGVEGDDSFAEQISTARRCLVATGLEALGGDDNDAAKALRVRYSAAGDVAEHADDPQGPSEFDQLHLRVIARQRDTLNDMRHDGDIAEDVYRRLLEELDWSEVEARSFTDNRLSPT